MAKRARPRKAGTSDKMQSEFPGVSQYKDRHGKVRWRYRLNGRTVNLGTEYGSPEFIRRYSAAVKGEPLTQRGGAAPRVSQAPQGSLSQVVESWYSSPEYTRLSDSTRMNYRRIAERLREDHGDKQIADLDRRTVKTLMQQKANTPEAANGLLRILRLLLDHAMEDLELIEQNPARQVKKYRSANPDGYHTWTEDEIAAFQDRWDEGTPADLTLAVMLYTGAARVDAVQLGPANLDNGRLRYRRQKLKTRGGGVLVDIPVHPELERRLDRLPKDQETFLQTDYGRPRSAAGLGNAMRKWTRAAGLSDCTPHGLRKACARRLAEAGATPHEIMSVTGHQTLAEVERYTSKVGRAALADRAMSLGTDDD